MKDKEAQDEIRQLKIDAGNRMSNAESNIKALRSQSQTQEHTILNLTARLRKLEDATGHVPKCEKCQQELPRG
jgi:hypothetical protein